MFIRSMVLTLGSLAILTTSFCTHKGSVGNRHVSSEKKQNDSENFEPIIVSTKQGHSLYVTEKYHNSRSATMEVQYQCADMTNPQKWETFLVGTFLGVSDPSGMIILLRYQPQGFLDLSTSSPKQTKEEKQKNQAVEKVYDLSIVCSN